jgi:hypothetical protein
MAYIKLTDAEKKQRSEYRKNKQYANTHKIIDNVDYKWCNKHKKYFPEEQEWFPSNNDYFHVNISNSIDGLHPECKRCGSAKFLDKYYNDGGITKQKTIEAAAIRYHTVESDRQIKLENGQRQREEGYQSDWRKNNPDKCRYYSSQHRDHDISKTEEKAMLKVFNYSCVYCGMTLKEHKYKFGEKFHNEHVDDDGYNDLRNDVPACKSCNCSKHTEDMETWFRRQSFFLEDKLNKIIWWTTEGYKDYIEDKLPYKIRKKQNEGLNTFHWELWTVDEGRDLIECVATAKNKKDLNKFINK